MPADSECEEPFKGRSCSKGSRVRSCARNRPGGVKKFRKSCACELEDDIKSDPLTEVLSPLVETDQPLCDAIQASNLTPTSSQKSGIVADISRQAKPINLFINEQELDQGLQKYFPVKDEIFEQQIDDHQICKKMSPKSVRNLWNIILNPRKA